MNEQQEAKQAEIIKHAHKEWLSHPITQQYLKVLSGYGEALLDQTGASAEVILASNRTARSVYQIASNTEHFTNLQLKLLTK